MEAADDDLVLEALGDRRRRAILRMLSGRARPVHELAAELQLHAEGIGALRAYVDDVWGEAISRFRLLADNAQPREGR